MRNFVVLMLCLGLAAGGAFAGEEVAKESKPIMVVMKTNMGDVEIELWPDKAPISVENFLRYTDEKFFDGTIFHRVMRGFMIQGGGFDEAMAKKDTHEPIKNEADNGLKNETGTIAMARTTVVDSATAQFFINTVNNHSLNHAGPGSRFGYAVFGKVTSGMDVVRKIEGTQTLTKGRFQNVPAETIKIESIRRK